MELTGNTYLIERNIERFVAFGAECEDVKAAVNSGNTLITRRKCTVKAPFQISDWNLVGAVKFVLVQAEESGQKVIKPSEGEKFELSDIPGAETINILATRKGGTVGNTVPNKLTSALELGKPILACIGGDGQALLEKTGGAVFAKAETPEGIAEAMLELASLDEKEKEKMGLANQAYFEKNLTLDLIVNQLLSLMDDKK